MKHKVSVTVIVEAEFSGDPEITPLIARALRHHADFISDQLGEQLGPATEGVHRILIEAGVIDVRWKFRRHPRLRMNMANWKKRQKYAARKSNGQRAVQSPA